MKIKHWAIIFIIALIVGKIVGAMAAGLESVILLIIALLLMAVRSVAIIAIAIILCKKAVNRKKQLHNDIHTIAEHYRKEP